MLVNGLVAMTASRSWDDECSLDPLPPIRAAAKLRRDWGASLEDISGFLGHGDLATTARYLKRIEGEDDDGWRAAAALLGVE